MGLDRRAIPYLGDGLDAGGFARDELALVRNARGDRAGAVEALLEIVAKDRSWQEEKARKQLVQFFDAWGPTDEAPHQR